MRRKKFDDICNLTKSSVVIHVQFNVIANPKVQPWFKIAFRFIEHSFDALIRFLNWSNFFVRFMLKCLSIHVSQLLHLSTVHAHAFIWYLGQSGMNCGLHFNINLGILIHLIFKIQSWYYQFNFLLKTSPWNQKIFKKICTFLRINS